MKKLHTVCFAKYLTSHHLQTHKRLRGHVSVTTWAQRSLISVSWTGPLGALFPLIDHVVAGPGNLWSPQTCSDPTSLANPGFGPHEHGKTKRDRPTHGFMSFYFQEAEGWIKVITCVHINDVKADVTPCETHAQSFYLVLGGVKLNGSLFDMSLLFSLQHTHKMCGLVSNTTTGMENVCINKHVRVSEIYGA